MENQANIENIIIIHLESLNEDILRKECDTGVLKNIKYLKDTGIYYSNYYSTATSTIMSMSDFMFGDRTVCEASTSLADFRLNDKKNLFEILGELGGVKSYVYMYPGFYGEELKNAKKIFRGSKDICCLNIYKEFLQGISDVISRDDKFCMYVYDWTSLNVNKFLKNADLTLEEICIMRYRHIDESIGYILDALQKNNKLTNTLLVLFGDHGDELYTGGFHHGFTHAIEPLYGIIKTPLIVKCGDNSGHVIDTLTDLTDIKDIIIQEVCPEKKTAEGPMKKYSFARNLFAAQKSKRLNKSFSVTDGSYLLIFNTQGMELYFTRYPCYRNINLLNFFTYSKRHGLRYTKYLKGFRIQHYNAMIERNREEFQRVFLELAERLKMELSRVENQSQIKDLKKYFPEKIRYDIDIQREMKKISIIEKLYMINDMLKREK